MTSERVDQSELIFLAWNLGDKTKNGKKVKEKKIATYKRKTDQRKNE